MLSSCTSSTSSESSKSDSLPKESTNTKISTEELKQLAASLPTPEFPGIAAYPNAVAVTKDGGIVKMVLRESSQKEHPAEWVKGVNVKLTWKAWAYVPVDEKGNHVIEGAGAGGGCGHHHDGHHGHHEHHIEHHCDHKNHNHNHKDHNNALSTAKPTRQLIISSDDYEPTPFELRIGFSFAFGALEHCVKSMNVGEKAKFLCFPPYTEGFVQLETSLRSTKDPSVTPFRGCCGSMASGASQLPPSLQTILHNTSPLELEISLLEIQPPGTFEKAVWELTNEEKWSQAPICKAEGVTLLKNSDVQGALRRFERAVMMLESLLMTGYGPKGMLHDEGVKKYGIHDDVFRELLIACRGNYALCKFKLQDWDVVIKQCTEILKDDPRNVKALFRRGVAYLNIGRDLEVARKDLEGCLVLEGGNTEEVRRELRRLEMVELKWKEKEKKMWRRILE